jgi:mitochondrial fission protein ELM1
VLTDYKPGHTTQSVGLAEALGWPQQVKALRFTVLNAVSNRLLGATRATVRRRGSAELVPPWPDVVIAAGRRTVPVARWIGEQSGGRTRLVQLGRLGGNVAHWFDAVVSCAYFQQPLDPRRVETIAPPNPIRPVRAATTARSLGDPSRELRRRAWPFWSAGAPFATA